MIKQARGDWYNASSRKRNEIRKAFRSAQARWQEGGRGSEGRWRSGNKGILKIAAELGVGSGTVQRIKAEMGP